MRLKPNQFALLVKYLKELYDYASLDFLLGTIGFDLGNIAGPTAGMGQVVPAVVRSAQKGQWLKELLDAVYAKKSPHPGFRKLYEELTAKQPGETPDPYETFLLHGQLAFVNRRKLRAHVQDLNKPYRFRILLVRGYPCSGKTFSKDFIFYLHERLSHLGEPPFQPIWIDLSRKDKAASPISALQLAQEIVGQIPQVELTEKLERAFKEERDPRWGRRFCTWLTGELAQSDCVHWLLLDGFDQCVLEEGTRELIEELASRVGNNLTSCRLILLGYDESLSHVRNRMYVEDIQEVAMGDSGRQELLEFITHLFMSKGQIADEGELPVKVAQKVAEILGNMDPQDPKRLESLGLQLTNAAREILPVGG